MSSRATPYTEHAQSGCDLLQLFGTCCVTCSMGPPARSNIVLLSYTGDSVTVSMRLCGGKMKSFTFS